MFFITGECDVSIYSSAGVTSDALSNLHVNIDMLYTGEIINTFLHVLCDTTTVLMKG